MTQKHAISVLKDMIENRENSFSFLPEKMKPQVRKEIEATKVAIKAVELQVAKPVERLSTYMDQITGLCPVCGRKDSDQRGFTSYCECGQKLLWE